MASCLNFTNQIKRFSSSGFISGEGEVRRRKYEVFFFASREMLWQKSEMCKKGMMNLDRCESIV